MDGYALDGDLLTVTAYSVPERKDVPVLKSFTNLYVKNFPNPLFTEEDLTVSHI